jgi:hypothetical protein
MPKLVKTLSLIDDELTVLEFALNNRLYVLDQNRLAYKLTGEGLEISTQLIAQTRSVLDRVRRLKYEG